MALRDLVEELEDADRQALELWLRDAYARRQRNRAKTGSAELEYGGANLFCGKSLCERRSKIAITAQRSDQQYLRLAVTKLIA